MKFEKSFMTLLTACMLLGTSSIFAKLIQLPADAIILGRSIIAISVLGSFVLIAKSTLKVEKKDRLFLLLVGLLMAGHWVFFYMSIQLTTIATAVITIFTYPIITALIEPIFTSKKYKWIELWFSFLVFFGILTLTKQQIVDGKLIYGIAIGLLSAFLIAVRNVLIKKNQSIIPATSLMFYQNFITFIILMPFSFSALTKASLHDVGLIILVGLGSSTIGHSLFIKSLKYFSATVTGIVSSMQIIYATILAWIIFSEPVTIHVIIGGGIVFYVVIHQMLEIKKSEI